MSSLLEDLAKSRVKAKTAAKKLEISALKKLIQSLTIALEAEEKRIKEKEEKERLNKIQKINQLLAESGLKVADLKQSGVSKRKPAKRKGGKRGPVAPKYKLVVDGVEHLWSGRGRTPLVFAQYFEKGNSRESVEI
ncbi:MAG: H-NS histone family protein [Porticoccaceae bacterium]|jgi:DNA-binding protein H-NS|nr:H-NS histone family protein [Porticoccaceae bacterium]